MTTRLDRVIALHKQGYTDAEIARELGLSSTRQVLRLKRLAGIEPTPYPEYTEELKAEIRRLSGEEGWPPEEIIATLGVSRDAVNKYQVQGAGVEWRTVSARLAMKHRQLWNELREKR